MAMEIQAPEDIISNFVYNLFKKQDEKKFFELANNWNKKIVLHVNQFYSITIIFNGNKISFDVGDDDSADLKIKLDLQTVLDSGYNRLNPIIVVLSGKIKIKGIYKIGTVLKFYKIFFNSLKNVAADPNENYFEVDKITR
ncbi:MAG: SCP2 sterol-binding domain-containing protein [Candidatus Hodarchaeota archaeon]